MTMRVFEGGVSFDVQKRDDGWYWRELRDGVHPQPWEPGPLPSCLVAFGVARMTLLQRPTMARTNGEETGAAAVPLH